MKDTPIMVAAMAKARKIRKNSFLLAPMMNPQLRYLLLNKFIFWFFYYKKSDLDPSFLLKALFYINLNSSFISDNETCSPKVLLRFLPLGRRECYFGVLSWSLSQIAIELFKEYPTPFMSSKAES